MAVKDLYYGTDHNVEWASMTDTSGTAVTGATVGWELLTTARASLSTPATGSLTHTSGGTYQGVIESSKFTGISGVSLGTLLLLEVTASFSGRDEKRTEVYRVSYKPFA